MGWSGPWSVGADKALVTTGAAPGDQVHEGQPGVRQRRSLDLQELAWHLDPGASLEVGSTKAGSLFVPFKPSKY